MGNCIFCKIAAGEIPCRKVYEDESVLAFYDLEPQAPVHILLIPKQHVASVSNLTEENKDVASHILLIAAKLASHLGIAESGYRVVTNVGKNGGQTVQHLHFHLLGGRSLAWPPG